MKRSQLLKIPQQGDRSPSDRKMVQSLDPWQKMALRDERSPSEVPRLPDNPADLLGPVIIHSGRGAKKLQPLGGLVAETTPASGNYRDKIKAGVFLNAHQSTKVIQNQDGTTVELFDDNPAISNRLTPTWPSINSKEGRVVPFKMDSELVHTGKAMTAVDSDIHLEALLAGNHKKKSSNCKVLPKIGVGGSSKNNNRFSNFKKTSKSRKKKGLLETLTKSEGDIQEELLLRLDIGKSSALKRRAHLLETSTSNSVTDIRSLADIELKPKQSLPAIKKSTPQRSKLKPTYKRVHFSSQSPTIITINELGVTPFIKVEKQAKKLKSILKRRKPGNWGRVASPDGRSSTASANSNSANERSIRSPPAARGYVSHAMSNFLSVPSPQSSSPIANTCSSPLLTSRSNASLPAFGCSVEFMRAMTTLEDS